MTSMTRAGFKHVMWDWNGTLFDDAGLCLEGMNELLCRRGMPLLSTERYQEIFDFPVIDYYRRAGFDFARESFQDLSVEFMEIYERRKVECGLHVHALEILHHINSIGLTQSVLSAYKQDLLESILDHFKLREGFVKVIGISDIFAASKLEQGRRWIADLGHPPTEVVLIGDTTHDFEVARAMGAACWLVPGGNQPRAKLEKCGVPVFDSLAEVMAAFPSSTPMDPR
ncbi:MAG: HAD hydrolase-like protein [Lentisphaerota bacterium]